MTARKLNPLEGAQLVPYIDLERVIISSREQAMCAYYHRTKKMPDVIVRKVVKRTKKGWAVYRWFMGNVKE